MLQDPRWDMDEAGKLLWDTAQVLRENGHCKFQVENDRGNMCLIGAMAHVRVGSAWGDAIDDAVYVEAYARIRDHLGVYSPVAWNNEYERTGDEVIAVCETVALKSKVIA